MAVIGGATFTRRRRLAIAANVLAASLLAPAVAGVLAYLAFRPELRARLDLTPRQTFTLSERTRRILDGLEREVDLYTVFQPVQFNESGVPVPGLEEVTRRIAQHAEDLAREYALQGGGRVDVHLYDPEVSAHIGRIGELGQMLGERPFNVLVVASGERRRVLRLQELAVYDEGPRATEGLRPARLYGFRDEEAITGAILAVTEERPRRVGFVQGHGERDLNEMRTDASGRSGYGGFAVALHGQNLELGLVDLTRQDLSRDAIDVVVLASPMLEPTADEIQKIVRYVKDGGSLLLLLDPQSPVALDYPLLDQLLGLLRLPGIVAQSTAMGHVFLDPFTLNLDQYGSSSPVVKPHRDRALMTQFHEAVALRPIGDAAHGDLHVDPLLWTEADAWLDLPDAEGRFNKSFDPATEEQGRRTLGFAVRLPEGGRAVVLGDSHAFDGDHLRAAPGNRALGVQALDWLAQREELISLGVTPYDELRADLTPAEYQTLFFYVVLAIPGLALGAAGAVLWSRRQ